MAPGDAAMRSRPEAAGILWTAGAYSVACGAGVEARDEMMGDASARDPVGYDGAKNGDDDADDDL